MNIQEYISSGIVQSYVLGLADEAERSEFERMCDLHPEVRAAREAFELSFEEYSVGHAVSPPANLKSRIFAAIDIENDQQDGTVTAPIAVAQPDSLPKKPARVVPMYNWQRYISAAAVILLLISTGLNFYFFNQSKKYSDQYRDLLAQQSQIVSNNQVLQTRMLEYEKAVEFMKDPDMTIVKMPAIPNSPDPASLTTVYWNQVTKDVFLAVNKLPLPAEGKQYQLWAMVDGKPVDAGVFDITEGPGLTRLKNIPRAQAFAITLEKKGGSATPTMDQLYVLGKV